MSVYEKENHEFLNSSLKSIVNQSVVADEIIIVKDGELNEKLNSVLSFFSKKFNQLKVIGYKKNRGLGYALNYGLNNSSNEIILCSIDITLSKLFI